MQNQWLELVRKSVAQFRHCELGFTTWQTPYLPRWCKGPFECLKQLKHRFKSSHWRRQSQSSLCPAMQPFVQSATNVRSPPNLQIICTGHERRLPGRRCRFVDRQSWVRNPEIRRCNASVHPGPSTNRQFHQSAMQYPGTKAQRIRRHAKKHPRPTPPQIDGKPLCRRMMLVRALSPGWLWRRLA